MSRRLRIHGIPSVYRGVGMRSRVETRWAALFDELGWPWQYEPIDLDGYIPDFALRFDDGPMLIEIKGIVLSPEDLADHTRKIELSGWEGEVLIVGATPWELAAAQPLLGSIGEPEIVRGEREWRWGEARIFKCLSCNHVSVLAAAGSWHCRICGTGNGNAHVGAFCIDAEERFEDIWARATNRVQWRPV